MPASWHAAFWRSEGNPFYPQITQINADEIRFAFGDQSRAAENLNLRKSA
jgi:hypothetical protein